MRKVASSLVWALLVSSLGISCQLGGFTLAKKLEPPVVVVKTLAQTIVDEYIDQLATVDLSRVTRAGLNYISSANLATLKSTIVNKITSDGLLTSTKVDVILGSMMKGVTAGVVTLGSGSMANDTRAGSILVSVAIKSSVQSLVSRPDTVPVETLKDAIGAVVKGGVASLSVVSKSDVVSLQKAIVQSVQDVVAETKSTTISATDAVKVAVSATVSIASESTTTSLKSADLMQAAFAGASTALKTANPSSTTLSSDLQAVVVASIETAQTANGGTFTGAQAENILEQAAVGLTADGGATINMKQLLTDIAAQASSTLSVTVDATKAVGVAAEVAPSAVLTASVSGHSLSAPLPFSTSGYQVALNSAGSTYAGTTLSLTCTGVVTGDPIDGIWSVSLRSPASYTFVLKVMNTGGMKVTYAEASLEIAPSKQKSIAVTGVKLDVIDLALKLGGDAGQLTATVTPADATNAIVTWASSDEKVATVNDTGLVTPVGLGTATLTVTSSDGAKKASATVTVKNPVVAVTGITLDKTSVTMTLGDPVVSLTPTITPSTATNLVVLWSSTNIVVASVDGTGKVTAKAVGKATITVTTADGAKTATTLVTVLPNGTSTGTISVETPLSQTVTITGPPQVTKTQGVLSYGASFTGVPLTYEWYYDGEKLTATTKNIELESTQLELGKHLLTVFITDSSGIAFSDSIDFWVVQ